MTKKVTIKESVHVFALAVLLNAVVSVLLGFYIVLADGDINPWLLLIAAQVCFLVATGIILWTKKINVKENFGLDKPPKPLNVFLFFALSVGLILLLIPVYNLFSSLLEKLGYVEKPDIFPIAGLSGWQLAGAAILMCVVPAICEEFVFRGIILQGFRTKKLDIKAVLISAVLFSLIHMNVEQTLHPLVMGVVFGFVYCLTESLWSCVILHFFNNRFAFVTSAFPATEAFLAGNWLWLMFAGIAMSATAGYFLWKQKDESSIISPARTDNLNFLDILFLVGAIGFCLSIWIAGLF